MIITIMAQKIAYTSSGDVAYSSPLMPPGVSIKSWYSKTEFHSSRKKITYVADVAAWTRVRVNTSC